MLIFLNKCSNNGRGLHHWKKLKKRLEDEYIGRNYTLISKISDLGPRLDEEVNKGETVFVAAGGDGTVNHLLNKLMQLKEVERKQLILGAIGLGSSNDFHKPYSDKSRLNGKVPFRLGWRNALPHNIGQVDFDDENDNHQRKYFIINCSIGIIACANHLFNSKEKIVDWLKSRWVLGTIWYSGLRTLLTTATINARLKVEDEFFSTEVTNLSVLINPHFSGNFRYDLKVSPGDEYFGIALCKQMGIPARIKTIFSLAKGRFVGLPGTRIWKTNRIEIYPDAPTALELDGEVCLARNIKINLLQGGLKVCT